MFVGIKRRGCQCILYTALGFRIRGGWSATAITVKIDTYPLSLFKRTIVKRKKKTKKTIMDLSEPRLTSSDLPHQTVS